MSIQNSIIQTAITTFITLLGQKDLFNHVKDEVLRTNESLPSATGADKRAKVLKDLEIILDHYAVPVGQSILNLCIELSVQWAKSKTPE
jgi:hypothetical protein